MSKEPTPIVLNPEQQVVADHVRGPILCPATAGSGKSTAIVARYKKLVTTHNVPPQRIMLVAFNTDAAKSLTRRIYGQVPWLMDTGEVARTTHSVALRIFQMEIDPEKKWRIDNSGALYTQAIRQAARSVGLAEAPMSLVKHLASRVKNNLIPYNEAMIRLGGLASSANNQIIRAAEETIAQVRERSGKVNATPSMLIDIFFGAEAIRTEGISTDSGTVRFIGFDDMLHTSAQLLQKDDATRERWASKYDYVIVDEAQDLNRAQQELVQAIASKSTNFMVVGDMAQCIYVWRGAYPEFLSDFQDDFPTARVVRMVRNYRSGRRIIDCANTILDMMPDSIRLGMRIVAEREDLGFVNYRVLQDTESEAQSVADNLRKHNEQGVDWRDMAVLVRTVAQTKAIEMAMLDAKIPTRMVSGQSFFALRETKILLAYIRVALGPASKEEFGYAVMYQSRFLGKAFVQKIVERAADPESAQDWVDIVRCALPVLDPRQRDAAEQWVTLMLRLRGKHDLTGETPHRLLLEVLEVTQFRAWATNADDVEADSAANENIDRVVEFVAEFPTGKQLFARLSELHEQQRASAAARNTVSVSTVHRAKGLEWKVVFIVGMAKGTFPISDGVAEEDRIAYVAVTRAKDELWISRPEVDCKNRTTQVSPYVSAMGLLEDGKPTGTQILRRGQLALLGEGTKS